MPVSTDLLYLGFALGGVLVVAVLASQFRRRGSKPRPIAAATPGKPLFTEVKPAPSTVENQQWSSIYRRVGTRSKYAGVGFVILTAILLLLSYLTQYIVFEIDSIIAFLAALVLFFSEPRRRVQTRVMDAILNSNQRSVAELAARQSDAYEYVPAASGVSGVNLSPVQSNPAHNEKSAPGFTPPGRALAELFVREAGIPVPSFDALEASLPQVVTENFGLARSAKLIRKDNTITLLLESPSFECPCRNDTDSPGSGVPGCTVASFLAVLVCAAESKPLMLTECSKDQSKDTWQVSVHLLNSGIGS